MVPGTIGPHGGWQPTHRFRQDAHVALFPVDCISHEGSLGLKRLCGQYGRPFVALRSAGWSSLSAALDRLAADRPSRAADEPARAAA